MMYRSAIRGVLASLVVLTGAARADQLSFIPSKDNTLYQTPDGSSSNGQGPTMYVGRTAQNFIRRSVVAFDLGFIPSGSTITQATLTMSMTRSRLDGSTSVTLNRLTADWGEGISNAGTPGGNGTESRPGDATWLHRFYPDMLWAAQGGDFNPTVSASTTVAGEGTYSWSSAAMVTDVQQWINSPASNFGWILRGAEAGTSTTKQFETSESSPAMRPVLRVTFTPPAGAGACCFMNGGCAVALPAACEQMGGVFQGAGVECASLPCPLPTGACCVPSGSCETVTEPACVAMQGVYNGDNTPCAAIRCPVVLTPFVDQLPIPAIAQPTSGQAGGAAAYTLPIQQFQMQMHRDLPPTTVWGVAGASPAPTIEASVDQPVTVTWVNDLRDEEGSYLNEHFLPVDRCLAGPMEFGPTPRTVIHLHGAHVGPESDGDPLQTLLPGELDVYNYPNSQGACTMWYHDHALGITRMNVYLGIAGFYLLRDPAEAALNLPSGEYDIPLIIQDKSFNPDGSLYYPPTWEDHFFGDTIVVNGKAWPSLNVKRGKYRFRILNGSGSRTYTLALSNSAPFQVIASDQGLLAAPVTVTSFTIAPSERVEVVMDFGIYPAGSAFTLMNSAPIDFPGKPGEGVVPNVMRFIVTSQTGHTAMVPPTLRSVPRTPESQARLARPFDIRLLPDSCHGTAWLINGQRYDVVVDTPRLGSTEIWSFINRSPLMHPMHIHLVRFQILDRQPFTIVNDRVTPAGPRIPPTGIETGWKDTVQAGPSEITRVIARFEGFTGYYAFHCHILEHEDNEMMRQMHVLPRCDCDRNSDGLIESGDFFSFVTSFFNGNADFNEDGRTTSQDFFDFLACFFGGCG